MFYEASTRTDMSFQAAMQRLGGGVIATSGGVQFSSVYKGENLADTVRAAACYADVIVLRHPEVGSSYEAAYYLDRLGERLGHKSVLISGGDGIGEHPTQALLDLFTIFDSKHAIDDLTITLVGDLRNGRTVHSLAKLIALYGVTGTRLCFVSPDSLRLPPAIIDFLRERQIDFLETDNLQDVLAASDVIYWTRIQQERFDDKADYDAIADDFIMTPDVLAGAKADAILMHPLPRRHEMGTPADHDVLDADKRSVYFRQMENGMFVRMALVAKATGQSMILRIPGMLDPHVHLRDLEWAHKATFASETAAALAGGYWAVLDMPNTPPPTITADALATEARAIARQAVCDWGLYFGAAQTNNDKEYFDVADQVVGLKIYNNATTGTLLIEDQAQRAAPLPRVGIRQANCRPRRGRNRRPDPRTGAPLPPPNSFLPHQHPRGNRPAPRRQSRRTADQHRRDPASPLLDRKRPSKARRVRLDEADAQDASRR